MKFLADWKRQLHVVCGVETFSWDPSDTSPEMRGELHQLVPHADDD